MDNLAGRTVLLVEDEPIIALDLRHHLEGAGARVLNARSVPEGLALVDHDGLAAALLDYVLNGEECTPICARLKDRGIPFVVYSGYAHVHETCREGEVVKKPTDCTELVAAVARALLQAPDAHDDRYGGRPLS